MIEGTGPFVPRWFPARWFPRKWFPGGPRAVEAPTRVVEEPTIPEALLNDPTYMQHTGVPPDFVPTETRLWSRNRCDTMFGGGLMTEDGMCSLVSAHPIRALELVRETIVEGYTPYDGRRSFWYGPLDRANPAIVELPTLADIGDGVTSLPEAGGDVTLEIAGRGDLGYNRWVTVYINDTPIATEVWKTTGSSTYTSYETLIVEQGIWNDLVLPSGTAAVKFEACPASEPVSGSGARVEGSYNIDVEGEITYTFANQEVCFPHKGYGFEMDANGMARPVTMTRPNYDLAEGVIASRGAGWICKENHPEGLGAPGMTVFALPIETPPMVPARFSAFVRMCGSPA